MGKWKIKAHTYFLLDEHRKLWSGFPSAVVEKWYLLCSVIIIYYSGLQRGEQNGYPEFIRLSRYRIWILCSCCYPKMLFRWSRMIVLHAFVYTYIFGMMQHRNGWYCSCCLLRWKFLIIKYLIFSITINWIRFFSVLHCWLQYN